LKECSPGGPGSFAVEQDDLFATGRLHTQSRRFPVDRPLSPEVALATSKYREHYLKTAKMLDLSVPSTLLARADEVIE
jgi:hypothetical protein